MVLLGMVVFTLMFIIIPGILTFNQLYWKMKGYDDAKREDSTG